MDSLYNIRGIGLISISLSNICSIDHIKKLLEIDRSNMWSILNETGEPDESNIYIRSFNLCIDALGSINSVPENGIQIFSGIINTNEKDEVFALAHVPTVKLITSTYICDDRFHINTPSLNLKESGAKPAGE